MCICLLLGQGGEGTIWGMPRGGAYNKWDAEGRGGEGVNME